MDIRSALTACIDKIPDTEEGTAALRKMYAIGKKAGKETRCAPKRRNNDSYPRDLMDEVVNVTIRKRAVR